MIRVIVFDGGDTILREQNFPGRLVDAPHVEALPHAAAVLAALRPHYRLAMASNAQISSAADMRAALRRVNLDHYFEVIVSSAEIGVAKPDPAFFAVVLRECGCAPAEAVMVGDTYAKDVVGARISGLHAIWYNWKDAARPPDDPHAPDAEIRDLRELAAAIRALDGAG